MTCAICGTEVQTMRHDFYEGVCQMSRTRGERPKREWSIIAPLYFKANADNTAMIEGYCGPRCSLVGHTARP